MKVSVLWPHFFLYIKPNAVDNIAQQIEEMLKPIIGTGELFLVEVEVKGSEQKPVVNIYLDAENRGLDIDECAKVSNELSLVLDAHQLLGEKYTLNVSSPGLDRPLKDIRQFRKNVGRKVSVSFDTDEGAKTIPGTFKEFDDQMLTVVKENDEPVRIPYESVTHAKVFPAW